MRWWHVFRGHRVRLVPIFRLREKPAMVLRGWRCSCGKEWVL